MGFYTSLTKKYMSKNKKRTIVTMIGIILSAALISGIGTIAETMIEFNYRTAVEENGFYYGEFNSIKGAKVKYLEDSVNASESIVEEAIGVVPLTNYKNKTLIINALSDEPKGLIPMEIKEGSFPKNSNEIAVSRITLEKLGQNLNIGSEVDLKVIDKNKNQKEKSFKIVGITNSIGESESGHNFFATSCIDNINESKDYNVYLTLKSKKDIRAQFEDMSAKADIEKVKDEYQNMVYPISYNEALLTIYGQSNYDSFNKFMTNFCIGIGTLVLIATIATVYNAFSISILERKKAFSTLASVGATKGQIKKVVFIEAMMMSVVSIPIGILCGTVALKLVFKIINTFLKESAIGIMNLHGVITLRVVLISFLVVFITIIISALMPAHAAAKTSPIEGIRGQKDYKFKKVKSGRLIKKIFGVEGQLSYKNLKRNKKKYRITLLSLVFSIVLFLTFTSIEGTFVKTFDIASGSFNYDFYIAGAITDGARKKINSVSNIEDITNLSFMTCESKFKESEFTDKAKEMFEVNGDTTLKSRFCAITDSEIENYIKKSDIDSFNKEEAIKENGVILVNSNIFMGNGNATEFEVLNLKFGDYITLNKENNGEAKVKILKITDKVPIGLDKTLKGPLLITNENVFNNVVNTMKLDAKTGVYHSINIKSNDTKKTAKQLEKIESEETIFVSSMDEERKNLDQTKIVMRIFLNGFVAIIALISVSNIVNTIQTNIALRKREFAMIQSIGVTPKGLNKILYFESMYYGIMSLFIGLPIGLLINYAIYNGLKKTIAFKYEFPFVYVAITVVAIFTIVYLAAYFPIKKLKKENIIENVKMENV